MAVTRTAAVTTLRPKVNSSCDVAAKYPRLGGPPTATESEPAGGRRGQPSSDCRGSGDGPRMRRRRLGSVLRSLPSAPRGRRSASPEGEPILHRGGDDTETERELPLRRRCEVSAPRCPSDGD